MADTQDGNGSPTIDALFLPQISDMHGLPFEEGEHRGCGKGWTIDPEFGTGTYWYLPIDDMAAIALLDIQFHEQIEFGGFVPNFFCFGSYGRNMVPYFAPYMDTVGGWESGTLLGYAWRSGMFQEAVPPNERLVVASISLMPDGAVRFAHDVGGDPIRLTSAIASLNGTHRIPALSRAFAEMRDARLSPIVAPSYYRCKVLEACAILVDWHERERNGATAPIRAIDRTSLNLACAWARNNLSDRIELEDLCRVACTSASKLAGLFKLAEGTTPMGWVREQRMERACELLTTTDDPISAVAASVGFARQGSFSEAFRERFGMTPNRYRALNREM